MREVLRTHSLSWAQTVRLALEARGITAVVLDENALGFIGLAGELRVAVADDAAAERAAVAIAEIPRPTTTPIVGKAWKWQRRGLKALAAGIVILAAGLWQWSKRAKEAG